MQTCSKCNTTSLDAALVCIHCQANLAEFSTSAVALKACRRTRAFA